MSKTRVDKWLWAVRIFKSRTISGNSCKANNVKVNDRLAKPSTTVEIDDVITVKKNGFNFEFRILRLINKRVGAPIAITCYENITPQEELNKYKMWFVGKGRPEMREKGAGRPTKKERREIEEYKESYFIEYDWDED